jgi:hypothetical protein
MVELIVESECEGIEEGGIEPAPYGGRNIRLCKRGSS